MSSRRAFDQFNQFLTLGMEFVTLAAQLHFLKLGQGTQAHVEDRFGLSVGQLEFLHHHRLGFILGPDDLNDPVEVEIGNDIAFEQLETSIDFLEPVLRPADEYLISGL